MLGDEEWVTQYLFDDDPPRNTPRPDRDHDGLSALRGHLNVHEAARYLRFQTHSPFDGDGVRHAQVKTLRESGFVVTLSPSRRIPIHVSVSTEAQWDEDAFHECWSEGNRWREAGE